MRLRMTYALLTLMVACLVVTTANGQAECGDDSTTDAPLFWDPINYTGHKPAGYHQWLKTMTGWCNYEMVSQQCVPKGL